MSDFGRQIVSGSNSSSAPASNGAINQNTEATKANTKAANKASGSLDAFKNWVETLFDWIEVRVERLTYKIDLSQARSENTNGYSGKNKQLNNAMRVIGALGTKKNTKTNRWTGGSGLLQDAQNGAIRYMEQATKVRQKAIANGLVDAKTADNIIKLIKEGAINISEYNEKTREFISQYKEWYDKSLELTSQIEELKQQLKELEQTKLDNITTQFEDLAGYSSAVQATSNAIVDFYTAQGRQVNAGSVKIQYEKQIEQQNAITAAYKKERAAYIAEMKNAEKIFGKTSNEYIEAQTKLEEINQALTESETAYRDLNKQLRELDISRIEAFIDRISSFSDKLESILSLRELRGGKVVEGNYNQQISTNNDLIQRYYQDINRRRAIIKEFGWRTDSENYQEYFDAIVKDEQAIFDLLEANEKLKESIVTLRWKPFNELQNLIKEAVADYDHLRSLFKDKQLFDEEDGIFMTNKGYASLALLGAQLEATKQQIADYRKALDKVQEDYDNGNITLDKYNETSREYIEIIQNSVKRVQQYNDAITELYKTQITNENAALQETISLRKKALQSKKAYYDYDKQLRDQNKDVNNLRAQINALQGVTNDAGRAKLARLRAELAEKESDREELIRNHNIEMQQQGYDQLSQDAQETLDDTLKALEANADKQEAVVNMMLGRLSGNYEEAYTAIQDVISHTGTVVGEMADNTVSSLDRIKEAAENAKSALNFDTLSDAITNAVKTITIDLQYTVNGVTGKNIQKIEADISSGKTEDKIDNETNASKSTREPTVIPATLVDEQKTTVSGANAEKKPTIASMVSQISDILTIGEEELTKSEKENLEKLVKEALKRRGYASGTLGTKKNELNWTHEGEIIRTRDGAILRQLPKGTQVIPRIESENLMRWANIDPNKFIENVANAKVGNVDYQQTVNNHYDSLLTVYGDVNKETLPELQEILRKACEYTNRVNARESRKLGMR